MQKNRRSDSIVTNFYFTERAWRLLQLHTGDGIEDCEVALATYRAACQRWPGTPVTLRQGARVVEDSRHLRLA